MANGSYEDMMTWDLLEELKRTIDAAEAGAVPSVELLEETLSRAESLAFESDGYKELIKVSQNLVAAINRATMMPGPERDHVLRARQAVEDALSGDR